MPPPDPVYIEIDSLNLERALTNLILNSIDASNKEQNIVISVSAKKNHVEAKVKDFGSGMDEETLDNIFVPFYSKKKSGTGLGMPIVKKIIDGHQGRISVTSQPGLGTEVIITLPRPGSAQSQYRGGHGQRNGCGQGYRVHDCHR